jgi:hypothetical protein
MPVHPGELRQVRIDSFRWFCQSALAQLITQQKSSHAGSLWNGALQDCWAVLVLTLMLGPIVVER